MQLTKKNTVLKKKFEKKYSIYIKFLTKGILGTSFHMYVSQVSESQVSGSQKGGHKCPDHKCPGHKCPGHKCPVTPTVGIHKGVLTANSDYGPEQK